MVEATRHQATLIQMQTFDTVDDNDGYGDGPMQQALLRFRKQQALHEFKDVDMPVLDIGTGNAEVIEHLMRAGVPCIGIDVAHTRLAHLKHEHHNASFANALGQELPFGENSFGGICAYEVIEHMTQDDGHIMLQEAYRTLKPGGKLVLSTVNRDAFSLSKALRRPSDHRVDHMYEYSYAQWPQLLHEIGFENVNVQGIGIFPPMWKMQRLVPFARIQDANISAAAKYPQHAAETLIIAQKPL